MSKSNSLTCSKCGAVWQKNAATNCWSGDPAKAPPQPGNCPANEHGETISECFDLYRSESDDARIAFAAGRVEGLCYLKSEGSIPQARWTRLEDTLAFAKLMEYKRIGVATCIGLLDETSRLIKVLRAQGFETHDVCCKSGSIDKLELGLEESDKVRPNTFEPACNPVAQAKILNEKQTDMNILMGLCIGHDMLFQKYADAPTTTLIVKDRVTGHNPVAALHGQHFYFKRLLAQPIDLNGSGE